jgi:hypothetical protein
MTPHLIDPTLRDGEQAGAPALVRHRPGRLRFNRNEFAGALGDIGTSLPLLVGVTLAAKLNVATVLTVFGAMQIFTALRYRLPMPVQPLKAMAALVIAQGISGSVLHGAGLAIGICMLIFTVTGGVDTLSRFVPLAVVRGLQLGLGLTLASLALKKYVASDGPAGYALAAVVFLIVLALFGNRRVPAALVAVGIGMIYAVLFKSGSLPRDWSVHLNLPQFSLPASQDILTGFVLLALPQIPLSLGNSVLATGQIARDLFPERRITNRMIGYTFADESRDSDVRRRSGLSWIGRHGGALCIRSTDRRLGPALWLGPAAGRRVLWPGFQLDGGSLSPAGTGRDAAF